MRETTAPEVIETTDTFEETTAPVIPEVVEEKVGFESIVNMPDQPLAVVQAPEVLLPNKEDGVKKAETRKTYLAFWKQNAQKWEAEAETLLAKLDAIIDEE